MNTLTPTWNGAKQPLERAAASEEAERIVSRGTSDLLGGGPSGARLLWRDYVRISKNF